MSEISTTSMEWLSAYNTRNASAFCPRAALLDDTQQIGEQRNTQAYALT